VPRIRVDMFEVQLGLSMLLQFELSDGSVVRVLADAGIRAHGYPADHVHRKLSAACIGIGSDLDLVIGTHYDADHLGGLVPILGDTSIRVGELWLPPVAGTPGPGSDGGTGDDDADAEGEFDDEAGLVSSKLLVGRLQRDHDGGVLRWILAVHLDLLRQLGDADRATRDWLPDAIEDTVDAADGLVAHFHEVLERADKRLALEPNPDSAGDTVPDIGDLDTAARSITLQQVGLLYTLHPRARGSAVTAAAAVARSAITAASLSAVVKAAKARGIPIRCRTIAFGTPDTYGWNGSAFALGAPPKDGLALKLLGPSRWLVRKHSKLLPVVLYLTAGAPPIKSITPSNQLSYTLRLVFEGQGVFVTGDAGCVDFKKPRATAYEAALLRECVPSHVLQVAHHAGNNAHFYRVLDAAGYDGAQLPAYQLLSHATHDRTRPSPAYEHFVTSLTKTAPIVLFTSEPDRTKVVGYRGYVGPLAPASRAAARCGDVRLTYDPGGWTLDAHAIVV